MQFGKRSMESETEKQRQWQLKKQADAILKRKFGGKKWFKKNFKKAGLLTYEK